MVNRHKVMNCKEWGAVKLSYPLAVSYKIDGVRAFFYPELPHLISRDGKPLYGFDHIIKELMLQPYDIDMELTIPGYSDWNKMAGEIRSHGACPTAIAHVIDVPSHPGQLPERLKARPAASECIKHIPHFKVSEACRLESLYKTALLGQYEGVVIKTLDHTYKNQRSGHWQRWVPMISIDVVIDGVYEGKGKMAGMLGGFYFWYRDNYCKVGTLKGIDFPMRQEIWDSSEYYIGRTIEVVFKEHQPSGKPRQPAFKGFRDDK